MNQREARAYVFLGLAWSLLSDLDSGAGWMLGTSLVTNENIPEADQKRIIKAAKQLANEFQDKYRRSQKEGE